MAMLGQIGTTTEGAWDMSFSDSESSDAKSDDQTPGADNSKTSKNQKEEQGAVKKTGRTN